MQPSDLIAIVGWAAAPIMNKVISNSFSGEARTLSFCISEVDLRDHKREIENLTANLGVQVFITSDRQTLQEPGYVSILVCNTSGKKLRDVSLSFGFSPTVAIRKHAWNFGARRDKFRPLLVYSNAISIKVDYLDENQSFNCFFLLDYYTPGTFFLDATSPEDEIKILQASSEDSSSRQKSSRSSVRPSRVLLLLLICFVSLLLVKVHNNHPRFFETNNPLYDFLHKEKM
jgi:hypothetical protein